MQNISGSLKIIFSFLFQIVLVLLNGSNINPVYGQVYGCKDTQANNYNPTATVNDGSCTYNITSYTPPVKVDPMNNILIESSGLQWAGGWLWSFNDGGGDAAIYKIDTLTNAIWQTVSLGGASNVDWEDIAFDGTYMYIGDFGNNANGARTDLKIYKFPLSALPDHTSTPVFTIPSGQIEIINFTYSDQAQPPIVSGSNNTKFDCEAMVVDAGKIHLFSKNWVDNNTTHYVINNIIAGNYVANNTETLATNYLVTAADKSPGSNVIALFGYQVTGFANHFMHILSDYKIDTFFSGNKRRIDLPNALTMGQGEGLTFRNATYGYISNEKFSTINQKLRSFNISDFVSPTVLPLELLNFEVFPSGKKHLIKWQFSEVVNKLKIQHSHNGVAFYDLYAYPNSNVNNEFSIVPSERLNYYRLSWLSTNGQSNFSKIIFLKHDKTTLFSNLIVKSNGEIHVNWKGEGKEKFDFTLTSVEGRILGIRNGYSCSEGWNKIGCSRSLMPLQFVIVTIRGEGIAESRLVQVLP